MLSSPAPCPSSSGLLSLLLPSCPWKSSAPCTLCCQASALRHSRPSLGEFWLGPVPAWPLNCHASQPARPQHCCRPFGYESRREDEKIRDVGSGWEECIFPVTREDLSFLLIFLHTPSNTHTLPTLMQVKDGVKNVGTTSAGTAVCIPGQVCRVS